MMIKYGITRLEVTGIPGEAHMKRQMAVRAGLLFWLTCYGCVAGNAVQSTSTALPVEFTATPAFTLAPTGTSPYSTATQTLTPGSTQLLPSSTPVATFTPTAIQQQSDESIATCQNNGVLEKPPEGFGLDGVIVYRDQDGKGLYSVGGNPLTYSHLPVLENQEYILFGFSPDGKWLAYSPVQYKSGQPTLDHPTISLLSYTGEKMDHPVDMQTIQSELEKNDTLVQWNSFPAGWLNDRLIFLYIQYKVITRNFFLYGLLDPFLANWHQDLFSELPDLNPDTGIGFSPDLSRALYTTDALLADDHLRVVLWDLTKHQEIGRFPQRFRNMESARWSSDSSTGAYMSFLDGAVALYLVSRDGKKVREIKSPQPDNLSGEIIFGGYFWSPDNNYLAITAGYHDKINDKWTNLFYIYDNTTDRFILECPILEKYASTLYWSPDAHYIALTDQLAASVPLIVFDLQNGSMIQLADKAIVSGWSDQFPTKWP
jgi:hypothetical protein